MEIRVNGERIDLEPEEGWSLGEALGRADAALEQSGSVIVGLAVDGRPVNGEDYAAVRDLPFEEVGLVEIAAEDASSYRSKAYYLLLELLELAKKAAAGQEASWAALREGSSELATSLAGLFGADELAHVRELAALLERAEAEATAAAAKIAAVAARSAATAAATAQTGLGGQAGDEARAGEALPLESTRAELTARVEGLRTLFAERLAELSSPIEELRKASSLFAREAEELRELPVLLQTGGEGRAMKAVLVFIEIFYKVIRLMPELRRAGLDTEALRVDGQALPAFYASFNEILRRFSQAFEDKDSVLIGDLAEYEVSPRMAGLFAAIEGGLQAP